MSTLTQLQRRFLSQHSLDADRSLSEVAAELKVPVPRLHYALQGLTERGVIRVMPWINRSRLGYTDFHLFFAVAAPSAKAREAFASQLAKTKGVVFFGDTGGDFHYELVLAASAAPLVADVLDSVAEKHRVQIQAKSIATCLRWQNYSKRYLAPSERRRIGSLSELQTPITFDTPLPFHPDELDSSLLRLLSRGGAQSLRDLGKVLNLTHTAVRYRVARLREQGVLQSMYYDVEPLQYGYQDFVLHYTVAHKRRALEAHLFAVADRVPAVSHAAAYFGAWDFELGIEVAKAEEIVTVGQQLSDLLGPEFTPTRTLMRFHYRTFCGYPF